MWVFVRGCARVGYYMKDMGMSMCHYFTKDMGQLLHERHGYVHVHVAGGSKIHAEKKVQSFVASGTTR